MAEDELRRTYRMIKERDQQKESGKGEAETGEVLTPTEEAQKQIEDRINSMLPPPELKPVNPAPINVKMNNQPARVLYETVCKLAGINVIRDTRANSLNTPTTISISPTSSLEDALDLIAVLTKTYWKPLTENTIFVTDETPTNRRDYEDLVVKVFYLKNITTPQELQELTTAVRGATDARRIFPYACSQRVRHPGNARPGGAGGEDRQRLRQAEIGSGGGLPDHGSHHGRTRELTSTLANGTTPGITRGAHFVPTERHHD